MSREQLIKFCADFTRLNFVARIERTHNIKIKRNKKNWGFFRNLKVRASNLQLWLMKVYRYLSLKKILL